MKRREVLTKGLALAAASSVVGAPAVLSESNKVYKWKMVTTWQPGFEIFQTSAEQFARKLEKLSGNRVKLKVFAGGELVPPFGVFDAVSQGVVEFGHTAAYYWSGKVPAAQFFTAVPFGFSAQQMNSWFYAGGAKELWDEVYAKHNLISFPALNTGVQMGGWFNKKIKTIADLNGLKMRIPGLGGKVISRSGVNVVLLPPAELYTSLERGVLDALEWVGPYHDMKLGFYKAAKYYYYPGWHEPGTTLELMINRKVWDSLPDDLKMLIESLIAENNIKTLAEFDSKNGDALETLTKKYKVEVLKFPDDVLKKLKKDASIVLNELADSDKEIRKVYDAFKRFAGKVENWTLKSEKAFLDAKLL